MTRGSLAARAVAACYALMAAVTVMATAVGFWLSYAGLHSFAARAGLRGPQAWAWPASVDLFILAGELGVTVAVLRDGRTDWRAWVYFAAGAGPSVAFNVLHVAAAPGWGRYAVAAAPPVAAVLALAALMQQVLSLPAALAHLHGQPGTLPGLRHDGAMAAVNGNGMSQARTGGDRVRDILSQDPGLAAAAVAERAGVSVRTVQRARNGAAKT